MEQLSDAMDVMNGIVWGPIMIILLVGTGVYLTIRLRFVQLRHLKHAIACVSGKYDNPEDKGDISHFQALCSALSATIGTGNIAGVATAIALGGPGAIFWMWVTALVGMATKFTSCSLAVRYRVIHPDGSASGGPMYFLEKGLNQKWLGILFALCAGFASFGIGSAVQANSVTDGLLSLMPETWQNDRLPAGLPLIGNSITLKVLIGVVLACMVGGVIIGGIKRIAGVASRIVPLMCVVYLTGALIILVINFSAIPDALIQIFRYAFSPIAVGGGFFGMVLSRTIQKGVARGIFSNESGLGSAPMAYAAAKTTEMAREGFVAMLGPLIDTIIICTMTALVIITSGLWQVKSDTGQVLYGPGGAGVPMKMTVNGESIQVIGTAGKAPEPFLDKNGQPYPLPTGVSLTAAAFAVSLPNVGNWIVSISLVFFAFSTIIAWSYYGDRCFEYLLGERAIKPYRYIYCLVVVLGAVGGLDLVWTIADNLNVLMAVPNLIALIGLAGVVAGETKDYLQRMHEN
ncbi:MAG: sodium:alanine symporter family protein [Sedimentisphaerales bacterium]|nr:sodium:alanine symporter family protein [Sedimentisphaerales bacterium]